MEEPWWKWGRFLGCSSDPAVINLEPWLDGRGLPGFGRLHIYLLTANALWCVCVCVAPTLAYFFLSLWPDQWPGLLATSSSNPHGLSSYTLLQLCFVHLHIKIMYPVQSDMPWLACLFVSDQTSAGIMPCNISCSHAAAVHQPFDQLTSSSCQRLWSTQTAAMHCLIRSLMITDQLRSGPSIKSK